MRKAVKDLADKITEAILPITLMHRNYGDILDAMCVVMAKTIQSTPAKGREMELVDVTHYIIAKAVADMIALEKEDSLDAGVLEFSKFAKSDEEE